MSDQPRKCKDCKGRGRYTVKETYSDGDTALVPYECGTCEGTGMIQDDSTTDFDIGGNTFNDDDD